MKKWMLITLLCLFSFTAVSCGTDHSAEIISFQTNLNTIVRKMEQLDANLNALDVTKDDAAQTALDALSDLNDAFQELAALHVTDETHTYITTLAKEGAEYMSRAYELFQTAYMQETFDEGNATLAYQYLERATKRVRVIVTMLHGEIPNDVVTK